jgi:hypothetical protein
MKFHFIYLLQVRSILCGMCFLIMNIIFSIFEANSQFPFLKMAINISFVFLHPTLRLSQHIFVESSINCYI